MTVTSTSQTTGPITAGDRDAGMKPPPAGATDHNSPLVEEDLLVEDVSIDGMCGVY